MKMLKKPTFKKLTFYFLLFVSFAFSCNNDNSNKEAELRLKEKELEIKIKEIELREKELSIDSIRKNISIENVTYKKEAVKIPKYYKNERGAKLRYLFEVDKDLFGFFDDGSYHPTTKFNNELTIQDIEYLCYSHTLYMFKYNVRDNCLYDDTFMYCYKTDDELFRKYNWLMIDFKWQININEVPRGDIVGSIPVYN